MSLEDHIARLDRECVWLRSECAWLRKRIEHMARFLPAERTYCPKCKALVHAAAKACAACGHSWGKPEDPKKGLPA